MEVLRRIIQSLHNFELTAHNLLSRCESAKKSRVILLDKSYKDLADLSLKQDELFREALRCVENELFRAAHVLSWAGFIDFLHDQLIKNLTELKKERPEWKVSNKEDLRKYPDYQIIETAEKLKILNKDEMKVFHGLLSKRNECAHPSDYFPNLNETLGYISELLNRIKKIQEQSNKGT
ncbi:MAG: hypothetical protein QFX37_07825 [Archaeoglobales archaeon]|nr:hypothetical protein [Archaeoglobales archaeon]